MTILAVDDEARQRRGTMNILRAIRPEHTHIGFPNGKSVLEYLARDNADLIICDINMPDIDGLTLMEQVNGLGRGIPVVFLSGYAYFEYAQRAMKLGAFGYLLKPADPSELQEVISRIETQREEKKQEDWLENTLDAAYPDYAEKQMNKWILGESVDAQFQHVVSKIGSAQKGVIILTKFRGLDAMMKAGTHQQDVRIRHELAKTMKANMHPVGTACSFFLLSNRNAMVTVLMRRAGPAGVALFREDLMRERLLCTLTEFEQTYPISAKAFQGQIEDDLPSRVASAFTLVTDAVPYAFYCEDEYIVDCARVSPNAPGFVWDDDALFDAIKHMDTDRAVSVLREQMPGGALEDMPEPVQLRGAAEALMNRCARLLSTVLDADSLSRFRQKAGDRLARCEGLTQFRCMLESTVAEIVAILDRNRGTRQNTFVRRFEQYLELNYMEDISLDSVAAALNLHPCYVSAQVKNLTGNTFSQNLLGVRLNKARALLSEMDLNIGEISSMVGYSTPSYFAQVFKREMGVPPEAYRQGIRGM